MTQTKQAGAVLAAIVFMSLPLAATPVLADPGHGPASTEGVDMGVEGSPSDVSRIVRVEMYDNYFEPDTIDVQAGETIRFIVSNDGVLIHEFNIGTFEMNAAHQEEMRMLMQGGVILADRIDQDAVVAMMASMGHGLHDDPNSVLLEPGETSEIIWTFPEDTSISLEYGCNVPGHYEAGMVGQFGLMQ